MCCVQAIEEYPDLKRNGILTPATSVNLEDIMLSEKKAKPVTEEHIYCADPLLQGTQKSQIYRNRKQKSGRQPGGRG